VVEWYVGAGVSAPCCRRRVVGAGVSAPGCRRRGVGAVLSAPGCRRRGIGADTPRMIYWRGDLRYIFIVAREQYTWIREHLDFVAKDYQVNGKQVKKPLIRVKGESWEWTLEPGRSPLIHQTVSSKRTTRLNKCAV